jgi:hypothetical protein
LRQSPNFSNRIKLMLPVQPLPKKINPFAICPNQIHKPRRPAPLNRGAFRDRHERWGPDAVDAFSAKDERMAKADGEVVWS